MDSTSIIIWGVLLLPVLGALGYWAVGLRRAWRTNRLLPTARQGMRLIPTQTGTPPVCIVVAAHNEAGVIDRLARSLLEQDYPNFRVVFALDRCTDDTQARLERLTAHDPRFVCMAVSACPDGWSGKVHALWQAVTTAPAAREAELLLFTDADTAFAPSCLSATIALLRQRRLDMLSLLSTLDAESWYERVVQPAVLVELVRQFPPLRANAPRPRAMANGQFILFRREAYLAIGGHANVRDELLEDMALAGFAADAGFRPGVLVADGMLRCRMYRAWPDFVRGWRRIFTEIAHRRPRRIRRAARITLWVHCLFPILTAGVAAAGLTLGLANASWPALAAGCVAAATLGALAATLILCSRMARFGVLSLTLYPFSCGVVAWLLWSAARDLESGRPIRWGGREYRRSPRYEPGPIRCYRSLVAAGHARMASSHAA